MGRIQHSAATRGKGGLPVADKTDSRKFRVLGIGNQKTKRDLYDGVRVERREERRIPLQLYLAT